MNPTSNRSASRWNLPGHLWTNRKTDETQLLLGQIYSLLMHCSGLLDASRRSEQRARLSRKAEKLSALARGADHVACRARAAQALKDACAAMQRAIRDPELGASRKVMR